MDNTTDQQYTNDAVQYENLVEMVTDLMSRLGHPRPNDWTRNLEPEAYTHQDIYYRRHKINRALRLIIGNVTTESTIDVRQCLFDKGGMPEWFSYMGREVIPFMVRLNIPPAIN